MNTKKFLMLTALAVSTSFQSNAQIPTPAEQLTWGNYVVWNTPATRILGTNVSFLEHLPTGNPANPPLLIYLHGDREKSTTAEYSHGLADKADAEGFIVAYLDVDFHTTMPTFDGADATTWMSVDAWDVDGSGDAFNEAFISNVIDHYVDNHDADPQRVYLLGQSRGAMVTLDMIPLLNDKVAAFGSYAGNNRTGVIPGYTLPAGGSAPVMMIQGTADPLVSYATGGTVDGRTWENTETSLAQLAALNGYPTAIPAPTATINTDPTDGCTVERFVYGENLELLRINGGGHGWAGTNMDMAAVDAAIFGTFGFPSFEAFFGNLCFDINATDEFWDFFEDKTLDCNNIAMYSWWTGTTSRPIQNGDYWTMFGGISRQEPGPDPTLGTWCVGALAPMESPETDSNIQEFSIFNVYPNPTQGTIVLNLNGVPLGSTLVNVLDINGRNVANDNFERSFDNSNEVFQLDLTHLERGIYTIQIQVGESTFHKKLMKN